MKKIIIAPAVAVIFSGTAMAADAIVYNEPVSAPVAHADTFSWEGGFAGVNAGYGFGRFKADGNSIKPRGFAGGVQAGYNWQFDGVVAGIEADFQGSNMKKKIYAYDDFLEADLNASAKVSWFGTIRGRLGAPIADRALLYGTAGLAYGKVKAASSISDEEDFVESHISKTRAGWTLGGGIEYALTENVTFNTEYLYTDLSKVTLPPVGDDDFGVGGNRVSFKISTIRAGVNYKF